MTAFLEVAPIIRLGTQRTTNIHYVRTTGTDYDEAQAAVSYIMNAYYDHVRPHVRNTTSYEGAMVRPLGGGGLPAIFVMPGVGSFNGALTEQALPRQIAALVSYGSVSPRPNRKRSYLGGFTEAGWDGGNWSVAVMTGLDRFGSEMIDMDASTAGVMQYVTIRLGTGGVVAGVNALTSYTVNAYAATQRRRRPS
jgi:hypothetical protein